MSNSVPAAPTHCNTPLTHSCQSVPVLPFVRLRARTRTGVLRRLAPTCPQTRFWPNITNSPEPDRMHQLHRRFAMCRDGGVPDLDFKKCLRSFVCFFCEFEPHPGLGVLRPLRLSTPVAGFGPQIGKMGQTRPKGHISEACCDMQGRWARLWSCSLFQDQTGSMILSMSSVSSTHSNYNVALIIRILRMLLVLGYVFKLFYFF